MSDKTRPQSKPGNIVTAPGPRDPGFTFSQELKHIVLEGSELLKEKHPDLVSAINDDVVDGTAAAAAMLPNKERSYSIDDLIDLYQRAGDDRAFLANLKLLMLYPKLRARINQELQIY